MPRLVWCAFAALLLLCSCTSSQASEPRRTARPKTEPARPHVPVVFMLGDSYTAGITSVPPEQTYAGETARRLGWQVVIAGYAGTGFVSRGRIGKDFAALYEAQLAWRPAPDMVVVSGGHNDVYYPYRVGPAANRLLTTIKSRWPKTHVVLVGPLWGGDPPPQALRVRDTLRGTAATLQVPFIDPLAERWITGNIHRRTGNARRFILRDGTHPTAAGNRHIAERLVAGLRARGLERPALGKPARRPAQQTPGAGRTANAEDRDDLKELQRRP
ncbi:Lysophospholipase L1 [Thermomonospora echinospora]|uniref:Lysophospholipase L1 n=1 Tax=Thermomonospora echinospora TaxID=1992 RepID=A0A1H6DL42_9ACTN|nr:SGNH/GDSL hydrolase family protein [Thermomonospora echinospora]SEG85904.1 Lysophospholipase L1 [Thermomonospora echinospora]